MPNEKLANVPTGHSTVTLLLVAVAGGIVAVSLQPLILGLYAQLGLTTATDCGNDSHSIDNNRSVNDDNWKTKNNDCATKKNVDAEKWSCCWRGISRAEK